MKLDKWPEEIECDGKRWKIFGPCKCQQRQGGEVVDVLEWCYIEQLPLKAPPTMREIMEHLVRGGWMRLEYKESIGLWRLNKKGELQVAWMDSGVFTIFRWKVSESIGWYDPDAKLMLVSAGPISPEEA